MRNLYELFSETESECIWFWIGPSIDTKQNFMKNCEKSGISVSNFYPGNAVSLHRDGELRHVSIMVWTAGFSADGFKTVPKIDYEKLSVVGQDYIITKCNLTPIVYQSSKE